MDEEKKDFSIVKETSPSASINNAYYDEDLNEPSQDDTLHRGLKARQISMIAVRVFLVL